MKRAGLEARIEDSSFLQGNPNIKSKKRLDVIANNFYPNGYAIATDTSIVCFSTLEQFDDITTTGPTPEPGAAALKREEEKITKYEEQVNQSGRAKFCPLIMETLGYWGDRQREMLNQLTKEMALITGLKASNLHFHWKATITLGVLGQLAIGIRKRYNEHCGLLAQMAMINNMTEEVGNFDISHMDRCARIHYARECAGSRVFHK